jgi:hypothetical protein
MRAHSPIAVVVIFREQEVLFVIEFLFIQLKILLPLFVGSLIRCKLNFHGLGLFIEDFDGVSNFIEFGMSGLMDGLVYAGMVLTHFIILIKLNLFIALIKIHQFDK